MPNSFAYLLYHVVFSTKDRREDLTPALREALDPYIDGIIRGEHGKLLAIGGTADHVHLQATFPPTVAVSEMMRRIKGNSSHWAPGRKSFAWQSGYGAFSVSRSAERSVRSYIERQEEHHRKLSFKEEYAGLLRKHGIAFDERYIWD